MLRIAVLVVAFSSAASEQAQLAGKLAEVMQHLAVDVGEDSSNVMAKQAKEAILALDTNKDKVIDWHEIEQFAQMQGFSGARAMKEFAAFDVNKDGLLDMTEVGGVLGAQPQKITLEKDTLEPHIDAMQDRQKQQVAVQPTPSKEESALAQQVQLNQNPQQMATEEMNKQPTGPSLVATQPAPSKEESVPATKTPWYLQPAYAPKDMDKIMPARPVAEDPKQALTQQKSNEVSKPSDLQPAIAPTTADQTPMETLDNDLRSVLGKSANLLELPLAASKYASGRNTHDARAERKLGNVQVLAERLAEEGKMESDAVELENMASTYHAQSTKLAQEAMKSALRAAQVASTEKTENVLATVQSMEDQALHAEVQAAAMHAKSAAEAHSAKDLMTIARSAMSRLRGLHARDY